MTGGCTHSAGETVFIDSQAKVGKLCPNGKLLAELVAHDKAGKTLFTVDVQVDISGQENEGAVSISNSSD